MQRAEIREIPPPINCGDGMINRTVMVVSAEIRDRRDSKGGFARVLTGQSCLFNGAGVWAGINKVLVGIPHGCFGILSDHLLPVARVFRGKGEWKMEAIRDEYVSKGGILRPWGRLKQLAGIVERGRETADGLIRLAAPGVRVHIKNHGKGRTGDGMVIVERRK